MPMSLREPLSVYFVLLYSPRPFYLRTWPTPVVDISSRDGQQGRQVCAEIHG